jgi:hypothetical protein
MIETMYLEGGIGDEGDDERRKMIISKPMILLILAILMCRNRAFAAGARRLLQCLAFR